MVTFLGRLALESWQLIWELKATPKLNCTQLLGAQPTPTLPIKTIMLRNMCNRWEPSLKLCSNTPELLRSMWSATPWVLQLEEKSSREGKPLIKRKEPMMSDLPFQAKSRPLLVSQEPILAWLLAGTWEPSLLAVTLTVSTLELCQLLDLQSSCQSWTVTLLLRVQMFTLSGQRTMIWFKCNAWCGAKSPAESIIKRKK